MRVTRLDRCGAPVYGPCSRVVSDGFVSVATTSNVDEGDTIELRNANGKMCVRHQPAPTTSGFTVEVNFCQVDPDLFALITGQRTVHDPLTGDTIGFRVNVDVSVDDFGWALEVWSTVPGEVCEPGSEGNYGYVLYPFLGGGTFGDFTIENDAVTFTVTGATTKSGAGWDVGPYDVTGDSTSPGPLTEAIEKGDHLHVQITGVAPPEPTCGCQPLDDPDAPPATGADAGDPGTWTPEPSNRPDDLAALQAGTVTANPATAWTAGQHVVLEDGSTAYWDGTAWAAGEGA